MDKNYCSCGHHSVYHTFCNEESICDICECDSFDGVRCFEGDED